MQQQAAANKPEGKPFKPLLDDYQATEAYDPNELLNCLIAKLRLKNDAALARTLKLAPPVLSKLRHRRLPVTAALLIRMHDVTGLQINELRKLAGIAIPKLS